MHDKHGSILHLGEVITFNEGTRPRWLIGRHGIVESWGEKRVKIKVSPVIWDGKKARIARVEPQVVVRGHHTIVNPLFESPELRMMTKKVTSQYVSGILKEAVIAKIISEKQKKSLIKLFIGE